MAERARPRRSVTLNPDTITYVEGYGQRNGGLTFSAALEAVITEHAEGRTSALLGAAIGTDDPAQHLALPSILRTRRRWVE